MKALCIGKSEYNFISYTDNFGMPNTFNSINEVIESLGGSGATVAYALGKFGAESYLGSVLGDDTFGNIIKKELEKAGVHTEYIETGYDKRTSMLLTLINKSNKEKCGYRIDKEKLVLKKHEFQMTPDLIYSDGYDYGASLTAFNKYPNAIKVINAKVCTQEMLELCKYGKYLIVPREFAEWVTGQALDLGNSNSLVSVFSKLLNRFIQKEIIVTLGSNGALYIADNQIKVMPGLNATLEDSGNAGDVFGAGLAYGLMRGYNLEQSITFANIAAGLSVSKVGVNESIASMSEIMTYFNQRYPESTTN